MPVAGRKPKPEGQRRNRVAPTHDWREVERIPFSGEVPAVPGWSRRSARTKRWWGVISRMPHCVLWDEADWQFAIETLDVYEQFAADPGKHSKTLMDREKILGTTLDFRRDLRIRYVELEPPTVDEEAAVTMLDDYRAQVAEG